jgi:hypothetical protein
MKRFLLQIIFAISPFYCTAQSLGYLDLPVVNELWIEFKDTTGANITITPAGTGQTWNFLSNFNVHDTIEFMPQMPSSVPVNISSLYPQANLVSQGEVPGDYTFIRTDLTGMYIDGKHSDVGIDVAGYTVNDINYTSDLLFLPIPFQYGDVVQNTSTYNYVFPDSNLLPGALVRVTYTTFQDMETDGLGELTTPIGNYPSVIRIKEMITKSILYEIDSFALGNYTFFTDMTFPTTYAYKWLKNGPNCLVMSASVNELNIVTEASYFTSGGLVGLHDESNKNNIYLNPNPVIKGSHLSLKINEQMATQVAIYDLSGRNIYQTQVNKDISKININTEMFESGLYCMNVMNNSETIKVLKFAVID